MADMDQDERDKLARAWGFTDAAELEMLHEQAFPGYAAAREQAKLEMAELQERVLAHVAAINESLPEGVSFVVSSIRPEKETPNAQ
jgi:hypothetical protein